MESQINNAPPPMPAPVRPKSVTVFGILCIVFGSLALLCSPFHAFSLSAPNNPVLTIPGFKTFALVGVVISLVCAVFQIAAGIGLLKLKRWARQGAVMYAIFAIAYTLLSLPVIVLMLVPHLSTTHDPVMQAGLIGGLIGGIVGGVIGMIYPICLLIFMRKPRAVAACCK